MKKFCAVMCVGAFIAMCCMADIIDSDIVGMTEGAIYEALLLTVFLLSGMMFNTISYSEEKRK